MTNPNRKFTFYLKGDPQPYTLQFDFNVICNAETQTDTNLLAALGGRGMDARQTRALLWALLVPANPEVTLGEAGFLLTRDLETVLDHLRKCLKDEEETEKKEDEPAPTSE